MYINFYLLVIFLFIGLDVEAAETVVLLGFGYVGILTHYLKKWSEKAEQEEPFYIRRFIPSIILSIITTSVLIVLRKELESLYVFTKFSSFVVGYFGNSWFFGFIEQKISNIKPVQNETIE